MNDTYTTYDDEFCPQDCKHLNLTEEQQEYQYALLKQKHPHWCNKYDVQVYHFLAHPNLYKCERCLKEGND